VPEEFLYRPEVRASPEQMGGERVPQGVRRRPLGKAQPAAETLNKRLNLAWTERRPSIGAEQGVIGLKTDG
jgi:hypothetical protein